MADYWALPRTPGVPDHSLELKIGAICTIKRNLSLEKGLVKNARVVIRNLLQHSVEVALIKPNTCSSTLPTEPNELIPIPRIVFEFAPPGNLP